MFAEYLLAYISVLLFFLMVIGGTLLVIYVILRSLFRKQFEHAKELLELLQKTSEFAKSEEAKEMLEAIKRLLITEKKKESVLNLPKKPNN